jgi:hypothetical protein
MSDSSAEIPHIVGPTSTELGKQCPTCGALFQEGDATVWVSQERRGHNGGREAVIVHVQCVQVRG